jgi:subtilisin family serine protease
MSNPHVSGIAATLLSRKSYANTQDLYNDIIQVATRDVLSFQWSKAATPNHNTLAYIGK